MTKKLSFLAFGLIILIAFFVAFQVQHTAQADSSVCSGSTPLTGYAWSSNTGWISFNGTNYGVCMDASGNLSGYGWADQSHVGWLSFNSGDVSACGSQGNINTGTGAVTGWARFIAPASSDTGWDGCVHLSGTNYASPQSNGLGGVTYTSSNTSLVGYAWGSNVVGWIHFCAPNGTDYCVKVNANPLTVSCAGLPVSANTGDTVTWTAMTSGGTGSYSYSWSGDDGLSGGGNGNGSTNTITHIYNTPKDPTNASVTVTDSSNGGSGIKNCSITVNATGQPPLTPNILEPIPDCTYVTVNWTYNLPSDGVDSYTVKRGVKIIYEGLGNTATESGLTADTPYTYKLYAHNQYGTSSAAQKSTRTLASCQSPNSANFYADPSVISKGTICNLKIAVNPTADTCAISGGTVYDPNFPGVPANQIDTIPNATSTRTTDQLYNSTTYTLTCANAPTKTATCTISPTYVEF